MAEQQDMNSTVAGSVNRASNPHQIRAPTDGELRPLVREVVRRSDELFVTVSERVAAFVLRGLALTDPDTFPLTSSSVSPDQVNASIDAAVARVTKLDDPAMETVKMQFALEAIHDEERNDRARTKERDGVRIDEQTREVVDAHARGEAMLQNLYRKMVALMALEGGVGLPQDTTVERETAQALLSVFPRSELKPFVSMQAADKVKRLRELSDIVLGIRLYNRATGKGGRDIDDVPVLAATEARENMLELENALETTAELTRNYADVINYLRHTQAAVAAERITRLTEELNNRRQFASFCERLLEDAASLRDEADKWKARYEREMSALKALVGTKQSVLKDQVYPKFIVVAKIWKTLTELLREARSHFRITKVLFSSTGTFTQTMTEEDVPEAEKFLRDRAAAENEGRVVQFDSEHRVLPPVKKLGADADGSGADAAELPRRIFYQATPDFMQLPIRFKGFCPHTIVEREGLLLQGDSSLGLVQYRGNNYAFVDEIGLTAFMQKPEQYVEGVIDIARRNPELIYLIGVQDSVYADPDLEREDFMPAIVRGVHRLLKRGPATCEAACETPTHFVESYIDPKYNWNEWEMRKQALTLYNLKDKRTRSQQTDLSHFRRENETQHYAPKAAETQTRYDTGTNVPIVKHYITGLRGHLHQKAAVVDLNVDLS